MALVSVIIPAYNVGTTIARTIRSVQRQTLEDLEIIVVDDGSTDDTVAQVKAIDDPRIVLRSYANGGLSMARNRGIAEAHGEYLAFLDADDLWSKTKLESHVAILAQRPEFGAIYSWTCTIDGNDRVLGRQNTATWEGDIYAQMLQGFFVGNASNVIVRRGAVESVGPFDVNLARGEDWEFATRLASRWAFAVVPEYAVFYRWRDGSISSDVERMRDGLLIACDKMYDDAPAALQSLKSVSLANSHLYVARSYLTRQSDRAAVAEAARSLRTVVALRPRMLLEATTVRLLVRWLIASTLSPQAARASAAWYHRSRWSERVPEADPWA